ncbi:uncharacterized protein K489DRAFT_384198 [Dissoconium aciculare CBS 342.82]|uniref:Protein kinase domain-containing protein n=1 Tax=Dissoconium aciculare CBS 342.82 TaxID=1314786 RepID=A0A6J3LUF5_9PEZI|nr:uncharacterized protein K489DRAFT_384198 [Dissoconium aciculare CBS 342.82]KAF1819278.1 hypothetical protein K489DRAFT_384198 [Dissoconium aciculare CBS 342.82]
MGPEKISVWHDSDDKSTPINLTSLCEIVSTHFDTPCRLAKIAEGGYHKVYEIYRADDQGSFSGTTSLNAVARVASTAFPKDKMMSEYNILALIHQCQYRQSWRGMWMLLILSAQSI